MLKYLTSFYICLVLSSTDCNDRIGQPFFHLACCIGYVVLTLGYIPAHDLAIFSGCLMQLALVLAWAYGPEDTSVGACAWSRGTTRGSLLSSFLYWITQCERLCSPRNKRVLTSRNAWTPCSESKSKVRVCVCVSVCVCVRVCACAWWMRKNFGFHAGTVALEGCRMLLGKCGRAQCK